MKIEQFLFVNSRTFGKDGPAFQVSGMKSRTEVTGSERACLFVAVIPSLIYGKEATWVALPGISPVHLS